ncbi:unnamed protein product [Mucor hiemalis]
MSDLSPDTIGFAVEPITNCPHIPPYTVEEIDYIHTPCQTCQDKVENWHCLFCKSVQCSRYRQGHMKEHVEESQHCVCISFSDLSVWCFQCDNYITHKDLEPIKYKLYVSKFGQEPPRGSSNNASGSSSSGSNLQ